LKPTPESVDPDAKPTETTKTNTRQPMSIVIYRDREKVGKQLKSANRSESGGGVSVKNGERKACKNQIKIITFFHTEMYRGEIYNRVKHIEESKNNNKVKSGCASKVSLE